MASSSSKSPNSNRRWKFHVFLSFRGEDTRNNFTDHLYKALKQGPFLTFRDDEELIRGEVISEELLKAIEESLISIVVLSENYASSTWCLDELLKILESRKLLGRKVLPIFYGVEPSAVRNQTGSFKEAFEKHEERFRDDTDKVQRWRKGLEEVAGLSGQDSTNLRETELIGKIVEEVWTKLRPELPTFNDDLVGIDTRIAHMYSLLRIEEDDVRFIGIWGLGGIGKTTLADVIFTSICSQFDIRCFLHNVREVSGESGHGLILLQRELLSHLGIRGMDIQTSIQGKGMIRSLLSNRKVLLVLDDVSSTIQLESLAGDKEWFGPGSRIIVTTRDSGILTSHGISAKYDIKILNEDESLQLFRRKAFKSNQPPQTQLLKLSNDVVQFAGGLPLAIEVIGSFLSQEDISLWEETLSVLRKDSQSDIWKMLRISFDGLLGEEKAIFLDIACFFNGWYKYHLTDILKKCGFQSRRGIEVLIRKSLVTVNIIGKVWMHDLLVEMGRNIVYQGCPTHACKGSRLWSLEDIDKVFRNNMGTESIQAIVLNLSRPYEARWNPEVFSKMCNVRLLIVSSGLHLPLGLKCLPSGLKVLIWEECPLESFPLGVQLDELVHLEMRKSRINQLCADIQAFSKLVSLNLSESKYLTITPNFAGIPNLTKLNLRGCINLVEVDSSIGLHKKLVEVNLVNCINLEKLPETLEMCSLERLFLDGCLNVRKVPEFGKNMVAFFCLTLRKTAIVELPLSLGYLTRLNYLSLDKCKKLKSLNMLPSNVENVTAADCNTMKQISLDPSISSFLDGIDFEEDVQTWRTTMTSQCRNQDFQSSTNAEQFNGKDTTSDARQPTEQNLIKSMDLDSMNNNDALECVDADNLIHLAHSISCLCPEIRELTLSDCSHTDESILQNLGLFSSLETLVLSGNNFVNLPNDCISKLLKLRILSMNNCRSLKSLPNLPPSVESVWLGNCQCLESLPNLPPSVNWVYLDNCQSLESLPTLPPNVEYVSLNGCQSLKSLPNLPPSVKCLYLDNCSGLESLPTLAPNVEYVTAMNCNSMKPPPDQYQQQIWGVLAASMERKCLRQETEKDIFECRYVFGVPGSEIPLWFDRQNYCVQNRASSEEKDFGEISITVEIPDNCYKSGRWGIAVCLVIQDMRPLDRRDGQLRCKSEINGVEENHFLHRYDDDEVQCVGFREGPHLFIVHCHVQDLQFDRTKIQLTFYFDSFDEYDEFDKSTFEIRKCGYRVFSKEDAEAWRKIMTSQCRIEGLQSSNDDEKQFDENDVISCDVGADQPAAKRTKLT